MWNSLRYTVRVLGRSPGFSAVAILSLALGIGANTAIFTLVNALLLRDLPVREPERLVELSVSRRGNSIPFSLPMFQEIERGQRVFSGLMGWSTTDAQNVEVDGVISLGNVLGVTGNYYSELGVAPLMGRLIQPDDARPGTMSPIAVIGYEYWQRRFGGSLGVLGRDILIEGKPFTIIGVTRKWFTGMTTGEPPDITIPITSEQLVWTRAPQSMSDRSLLWIAATGRLKDGVTIVQARSQLQSFWPDVLKATAPTQEPGLRRQTFLSMGLDVSPAAKGIARDLRGQFTKPLYLLMGIVGLILLVACANLANLMLARAAGRSHEMSVRVALGATRWGLARQVLSESLVLSLAGAALGFGFAYWGSRLLVAVMTKEYLTPVALDLRPDFRVLLLTLAVATLTAILFGLAPAWRSSGEDPAVVLQQGSRSVAGGASGLAKALIVAQVALSLVLLLGAGLLLRSFRALRSVNTGFARESVLEVTLNPRPGVDQNADVENYHRQLADRVANLPGVQSVAFSVSSVPTQEVGSRDAVAPTAAEVSLNTGVMTNPEMVSPGFFSTVGIAILRGREFDWTDDRQHPNVAIVSRGLAKKLFPNGNAIGQRVRDGFMPELQNLEIVGIAGDARLFDLRAADAPVIYVPALQHGDFESWQQLFVRANEAPDALARSVGHEVESFGREYVFRSRTVSEVIDQALTEERVIAALSGFFAALALLLASVGLYGLMSYAVTRRTREMGIRVALGAQSTTVLALVLRETVALVLAGIVVGIPCGLAATHLIASMLFGLSANDVPTIAGVSVVLIVVALMAGYMPARRAARIDPMMALRSE